jgi:hypothetical protein
MEEAVESWVPGRIVCCRTDECADEKFYLGKIMKDTKEDELAADGKVKLHWYEKVPSQPWTYRLAWLKGKKRKGKKRIKYAATDRVPRDAVQGNVELTKAGKVKANSQAWINDYVSFWDDVPVD